MLESPGRQKVVGIVDPMPLVEIDDSPDAVLVSVGFGHRRLGREIEAGGLEDQMVGDPPCRGQVFLEQGRRHRQRFARVVEPCFVRRVDGKLSGRPDVDTGQVADRVVELGIAQPPRQHPPGIAGVSLGFAVEHGGDPLDDRAPFVRRRLAPGLLRRHLIRFEPLTHEHPHLVVLDDRRNGGVHAQVQLALGLLAAVAAKAVLFQERKDRLIEAVFERRLQGDAGRRREQEHKWGDRGW